MGGLEHFQAQWVPVRRPKMRKNKELERRSDSIGTKSALGRFKAHFLALPVIFLLGACATIPTPTPSESDWSMIRSTMQEALENARTGESLTWENPETNNRGTVIPLETDDERVDQPCRRYQLTFTAENTTQAAYGTACRRDDGTWESRRAIRFGPIEARRDPYYYDPYYYDPYYYDPFYDPFYRPYGYRQHPRVRGSIGFHFGRGF